MMAFHNRCFMSGAGHKLNVTETTCGLKATKPSLAYLEGFIIGSLTKMLLEAFEQG